MVLRSWLPRLLLTLVIFLPACASSSGTSGGGPRDTITRADITASSATTAYEAVRLLRPAFLRSRGGSAPVLYVDGVYRGDLRGMEQIPAATVQEIRYLDSTDATMRYGTGHTGGAVLVTTQTE